MTAWDVVNEVMKVFPPVAAGLFLLAVGVIFAVGFARHGMNFIKYGFKQSGVADLVDKLATKDDINGLNAKFEARFSRLDERLDGMDTRIAAIETNHFGHLKNFLTELTSILLDKQILNHQDKARLDNQLRGM